MQTLYRGTQRTSAEGVRKAHSYAYSLPVAVIWSARPGDVWSNTKTKFLPTSTIHMIEANIRNPLKLGERYESFSGLGDILEKLEFETSNGITKQEVLKVYNYLHNRLIGKASGGEFSYVVVDEEGNDIFNEDDIPLSFSHPQTLVSLAKEEWNYEPNIKTANYLIADAFIFADAPAVQRAALALGYDALIYSDVFQGGEDAARELLGKNVQELPGIEIQRDLNGKRVPTHITVRPLSADVIIDAVSFPTEELLAGEIF